MINPETRLIYKLSYSRSVAVVVTSYFQDNEFMAVTQNLLTLAGEFIASGRGIPQQQRKENEL